jgi:hypothetical protein
MFAWATPKRKEAYITFYSHYGTAMDKKTHLRTQLIEK